MKYKSEKEKRLNSIYEKYSDDIYRTCFYLMKDKDLAQDIMEKAFVKIYKCLDEISPGHEFVYLIHEVKNLAANRWMK